MDVWSLLELNSELTFYIAQREYAIWLITGFGLHALKVYRQFADALLSAEVEETIWPLDSAVEDLGSAGPTDSLIVLATGSGETKRMYVLNAGVFEVQCAFREWPLKDRMRLPENRLVKHIAAVDDVNISLPFAPNPPNPLS
jgi:hypothetical protein